MTIKDSPVWENIFKKITRWQAVRTWRLKLWVGEKVRGNIGGEILAQILKDANAWYIHRITSGLESKDYWYSVEMWKNREKTFYSNCNNHLRGYFY